MSAQLSIVYTLSQTHCGTGQASQAVDLPIAREASTGLPILPSTTLKGVARATIEGTSLEPSGEDSKESKLSRKTLIELFGSELSDPDSSKEKEGSSKLTAGALVVGEGHLLAYPFRALHQPLLFGTCPLLLERLDRALRAGGVSSPLSEKREDLGSRDVLTALEAEAGSDILLATSHSGPVVVEDRIFSKENVKTSPVAAVAGEILAGYLPAQEARTAARLQRSVAILPDAVFCQIIARVPPVQARIKLTSGKTTGPYMNPETEKEERGNLWYEETLPSDCLFWCLLQHRTGKPNLAGKTVLETLTELWTGLRHVQIGGNETVGQGQCFWHIPGVGNG